MAYNFKTERGVPMRKNLSKKLTAYITKNRYLLALFMGVLAGTFFANCYGKDNIDVWGLYNKDYLEMMSMVSLNYRQLWWYVAANRIKLVGILALCMMTTVRGILMLAVTCFGGAELGVMVSMSVMQYGMAGVLLVAASLLPQWIFYTAVMMMAINVTHVANNKKAPAAAAALVLILAGICTEVLVNPVLVKNVIYMIY